MQLPTIHLNGTSKQSLIDGLCHAYSAIDTAVDALKKTAPNGRDFYPQGPEAFTRANDEHWNRLKRLTDVQAEVQDLVNQIYDME